jgi:hypothetical protein
MSPRFAETNSPTMPSGREKIAPIKSDDVSATFELDPPTSLSFFTATIPMTCSADGPPGALEISFDLGKPGDPLTPQLHDR